MIDIKYFQKCRYIDRLSHGYKTRQYNIMEHQWMVGMLFRHFASLEDVSYDINVWDIVLKHDLVESESGDLPWPIKSLSDKTKESWGIIEDELLKQHFQLQKYSDENIKKSLTRTQFLLFKMCDVLDLFLFVKEEISFGNRSKFIMEVESNCHKIFKDLQSEIKFKHIQKFIDSYA